MTARNVLTFKLSHSPVEIQLLSNQSLYVLVDTICKESAIGKKDTVSNNMMWCAVIEGREYFSTDSPEFISMADLHLTTDIKFDSKFLWHFLVLI